MKIAKRNSKNKNNKKYLLLTKLKLKIQTIDEVDYKSIIAKIISSCEHDYSLFQEFQALLAVCCAKKFLIRHRN